MGCVVMNSGLKMLIKSMLKFLCAQPIDINLESLRRNSGLLTFDRKLWFSVKDHKHTLNFGSFLIEAFHCLNLNIAHFTYVAWSGKTCKMSFDG